MPSGGATSTTTEPSRSPTLGDAEEGFYLKEPKTQNFARTIPLARRMLQALRTMRAGWLRAAEFGLLDPFVLGAQGPESRPHNPTQLGKDFVALCKMNGFHCTFHDLRNALATMMIAVVANVRTVASCLGHASVSATLNIDADVDMAAASPIKCDLFGNEPASQPQGLAFAVGQLHTGLGREHALDRIGIEPQRRYAGGPSAFGRQWAERAFTLRYPCAASARSISLASTPADAAASCTLTRPSRTNPQIVSSLPLASPLASPSARISSMTLPMAILPTSVSLSLRFSLEVSGKRASSYASPSTKSLMRAATSLPSLARAFTYTSARPLSPASPVSRRTLSIWYSERAAPKGSNSQTIATQTSGTSSKRSPGPVLSAVTSDA